jgi:hypothetical protein
MKTPMFNPAEYVECGEVFVPTSSKSLTCKGKCTHARTRRQRMLSNRAKVARMKKQM